MDSKTLIKALKIAVREVIQEELTEILREGLQSTITEMTQPKKQVNVDPNKTIRVEPRVVSESGKKQKVQFNDNKWASILNETDSLIEQQPLAMNSFRDLMNEEIEEIRMTSRDAVNFGTNRQIINQSNTPSVMEDPEDGKIYDVAPEIQQALTRDYSALMKAIDRKKGK